MGSLSFCYIPGKTERGHYFFGSSGMESLGVAHHANPCWLAALVKFLSTDSEGVEGYV